MHGCLTRARGPDLRNLNQALQNGLDHQPDKSKLTYFLFLNSFKFLCYMNLIQQQKSSRLIYYIQITFKRPKFKISS
jgi:hypothetical protein